MAGTARKFVRVTKFLLAGVTVFCVSWIASVNEWHASVRWSDSHTSLGRLSTMRTIVAYSEGKQAEMDRPSPVGCDRLPDFPEVPLINRTWSPGIIRKSSWQQVAGTQVSLYAAYYDERTTQRYVRILASFHGRNYSADNELYCQTRSLKPYENNVEVVAAKPLEIWWFEWDRSSTDVDTPLLLSCSLTEPLIGPSIVSVVTEPCDNPTNAFPLEPVEKTQNRNFTICVKDMNFDRDISQSLVEWVETNKILGADIIDVYVDKISKQTANVLQHYQDEGYIRLFDVPVSDDPGRSLWQRRRDHIITYNDCLYRNMRESTYVIPLDIDEIVLPKIAYTWPELLHRLKHYGWNPKKYSAIMIQNVFFFDFMQKIRNNKNDDINKRKNTLYVKRDAVRIEGSESIDIDQLKFIDDNNYVLNANLGDKILLNKYKARCHMDLPEPKLSRHIVSSAVISPIGFYSKSFMVTKKVLTAFNHYPLASLGTSGFTGWSAPFNEVQLNHYKESCNKTVVAECGQYEERTRIDRTALRLRNNITRALATAICIPINNI